jgi:hypothetical protein
MRGSALPKGCHHIDRATNYFRRAVEDAVMEAKGEIGLVDACRISTAYRAERTAQLAQRWLLREAENLSAADRLAYAREVVRVSESRDRAIAALGLEKRPQDIWQALHAALPATTDNGKEATPHDPQ